jgi:hypothetical protein
MNVSPPGEARPATTASDIDGSEEIVGFFREILDKSFINFKRRIPRNRKVDSRASAPFPKHQKSETKAAQRERGRFGH